MSPHDKFSAIRHELQQTFLERADLIDGALAALLSSQHVLIIGPPGTAKSMLADALCRRITGGTYFQWLLTKFTTPEELFGAVSLKALEADDYRRVTDHKLPEDDELLALYDRFLLRFVVDYISEDFRFLKMLQAPSPAQSTTISLDELRQMQDEVRAIRVPDAVLSVLADIRRELGKKNIIASDRRYRQSLSLLQALAYLYGRTEVNESDLFFLEHVLWKEPSEQGEVHAVIQSLIHGYEDTVQELLFQTRELRDYAEREWEDAEQHARAVIEAHTKIRRILVQVEEISQQAQQGGRPLEKVVAIRQEIEGIQQQLLEKI